MNQDNIDELESYYTNEIDNIFSKITSEESNRLVSNLIETLQDCIDKVDVRCGVDKFRYFIERVMGIATSGCDNDTTVSELERSVEKINRVDIIVFDYAYSP